MQLEAIERQTTVDLVVDRLAQAIKDQKLAAGSRLPGEHELPGEHKLVEQLQVSRPAPREPLARLHSLGFGRYSARPRYIRRGQKRSGQLFLMQNLMEVIYEFVLIQMVRTTPTQREHQLGRRLHKTVLTAVRAHDPDAAELAMREHMNDVLLKAGCG